MRNSWKSARTSGSAGCCAKASDATLKKATLNAVAAAQKIGGEIHVLVAGSGAGAAAKAAGQAAGVAKVLHADGASVAEGLAENVAALLVSLAKNYSHLLAPDVAPDGVGGDGVVVSLCF